MTYVTMIGFVAAGLVIATLSMRTMIPLRLIGIASNVAFVTYGALFGSIPTVMLHSILFPLNIYRLYEMLRLIKQVDAASKGDMGRTGSDPFAACKAPAGGSCGQDKRLAANAAYKKAASDRPDRRGRQTRRVRKFRAKLKLAPISRQRNADFHFLRRPSRLTPPRPIAKSGSAVT